MIALLLALATPGDWRVEAEGDAKVTTRGDVLDIDSAKGVTLWWTRPLRGPTTIDYDVRAVSAGGANDTVSDVNAFWMATENDGALPRPRGGAFADYDTLRTYYVGIGGNRNTTTRFRRYTGRPGDRPLLPQHDRKDALVPNRWMHIRLIADGRHIAVERDGVTLFTLDDAAPYTRGLFGLRTTWSHLQVRRVRIARYRTRLRPHSSS